MEEFSFEDDCEKLRDTRDSIAANLEWKIQQLERRVDMRNQDKEIGREYTPEYEKLYSLDTFSATKTSDGLSNPVECLLERVLIMATTEALCERFFHKSSLTVKRRHE